MTVIDPWSDVVGQDEAVSRLRASLHSPVHAYLFIGPEGSGRRAAARAFAAELLSEGLDDDAVARSRQLAATESHPAMTVVERDGASIDAKQAREIVRQASLAPAEGSRQVIVLVDFHLVTDVGAILLKSIEEPPPTTVFLILAEELPPHLETVASRCVRVDFSSVSDAAIIERLVSEGIDADVAATAALGAGGSLARARLLSRDPEVAARRAAWYGAPSRLDGTGAAACNQVDELLGMIDAVMAPLAEQHSEEIASYIAGFESAGVEVRKGDLKRLEDRHKREQRRVRGDELRSGLGVLVSRYRDEVAAGSLPAEEFVSAATLVQQVCERLVFNPNEALALRALFVSVPLLTSRSVAR